MDKKTKELFDALVDDGSIMVRLENAANSQEVSDILAEAGFNIDASKIDAFMDQLLGEGELDENQLDMVAGGGFKLRYLNPVYWVGRLLAWAVTKDIC